MLIKRNVLTMTEGNTLLNAINKLDLPLYEKNIHTKLDDNFEWTDTIFKMTLIFVNRHPGSGFWEVGVAQS